MTALRRNPRYRRHRRVVPFLLLSLLLHLVALVVVPDWRRQRPESRVFEMRLLQATRFEARRLTVPRPRSAPVPDLEYHGVPLPPPPSAATPSPRVEPQLPRPPGPELVLKPVDVGARPDTFQAPSGQGPGSLAASVPSPGAAGRLEALELLRLQDLARGRDRAVVLVDPASRVHLQGFLNLTQVRIPGAGSGRGGGLEALARYMRDHTDLLVQVRPQATDLRDSQLRRDPVLFLVEGGGDPLGQDWPPVRLSSGDLAALEGYMRAGGLLVVEGGYRYLAYMKDVVARMFGGEAGIRPLPLDHPIYHAFYDFDAGFPGEQKGTYVFPEGLPASWDYPAARYPEAVQANAVPLNQAPINAPEQALPRLGLWSVSLGDTLVALFSDLDLVAGWAASQTQDEELAADVAPSFYAGVNLVVHALTRRGTLAGRRALPAWMRRRPQVRPGAPLAAAGDTVGLAADPAPDHDPALDEVLDASLAVVRAPLGTPVGAGGITVRVDGRYRVDVLRGQRHGVLLHNLDAGTHWVEIEVDGKGTGLEVDVRGGRVTTLTFGVSRFAMLHRVGLTLQPTRVDLVAWRRTFTDLDVEEVFLGSEQDLPPPPAP